MTLFLSPRTRRGFALLGIGIGTLALPGIGSASLGGQEASVADDAVAAHATIRMQQRTTYRLHEIVLESGATLREYVNAAGTVFAVAWQGSMMPNLNQMLGQYFPVYRERAQLKQAPHRAVRVQQDDIVIESTGHMRDYRGFAYLPPLMPAGVTVGDLK